MTESDKFFNGIKGKKIAMIGAGVSHVELIESFLKKGLDVTLCDKKTADSLGAVYDRLKEQGCKFSLGENYLKEIYSSDIVFRTPGMYYLSPELTKARKMGIAVTSETEVFFDICPCKIIAVTGTEGKTTTTTIITEMLSRSGVTVHKGGNIGKALLPMIDNIKENDVVAAELSSFQLISMRRSPDYALITNIYPDHLNVHSGMEEYINAKKNLIIHQNAFSKTVLNMDNAETLKLAECVRGRLLMFSRKAVPEMGTYLDGEGYICYTDGRNTERLFNKDDIKIPGMHNVENYLAAAALLYGDVSADIMKNTAQTFGGVEHRIEYVRTLDGVKYYNDSIATSPPAVIAGLEAFDRKVIVIAGGSDKGLDYGELAEPLCRKAKLLILTGDTSDMIENAVTKTEGHCPIIRANSMEEAVKAARENAVSGDVVTLSPASASFDRYKNFEERGKHYKSIVNSLK